MMKLKRAAVGFGAWFVSLWALSGLEASPVWKWRNPVPQGSDFYGVAYGGDRFVAVGGGGMIYSSADGVAWETPLSSVNAGYSLSSVAYGDGRFVVFGYPLSGVLTSTDGRVWSTAGGTVPDQWKKVSRLVYAKDRFFATSLALNFVATSPDGLTWTKSEQASALNVGRIAYANGIFLGQDTVTGQLRSTENSVWTYEEARMVVSTDGETWAPAGNTGLAAISAGPVYCNGRWLVGGTLALNDTGTTQFPRAISYSTDNGATWTIDWHDPVIRSAGNAYFPSLAVFKDRAYLLGIDTSLIGSTLDGITVQSEVSDSSGGAPVQFNAFAASADRIVAVGRYGTVWSSANGSNWEALNTNAVPTNLRGAAYGAGRWIAAGESMLATSEDGIAWSPLVTGRTFSGSVAFGNGRFVVGNGENGVNVSTDGGVTWTASAALGGPIRHMRFVAGQFVAAVDLPWGQSSKLMHSTDGVTWVEGVGVGSNRAWNGLSEIGGVVFAAGTNTVDESGVILRSTDGAVWQEVATAPDRVFAIAGNAGWHVATTLEGRALVSTDGLTWTLQAGMPLSPFGPVSAMVEIDGQIVAATSFGKIVTTLDGRGWQLDEFGASGMVFDLVVGNGQVLAVGNGGLIWEVAAARFVNNSARASVGTGENLLVSGFVIGGTEPQTILARAAGPALSANGVDNALAAPVLRIKTAGGRVVGENVGWSTGPNPTALVEAATKVGAFSFKETDADSAVLIELEPGAYTAQVSGSGESTGVALVELYAVSRGAARLVNISTRINVGTDENVLITGFVVTGNTQKSLLVRAIGPGLRPYGVESVLEHPVLEIWQGKQLIHRNEGWASEGGHDSMVDNFNRVGAFPLADGSADCAVAINLRPGAYTVKVYGAEGTTGIALAEVYELP